MGWDYRTQLALQEFLNLKGVKVSMDGNFGSSSTKGLQKFLNNNWDAAGAHGASKLWRDGSFGKKTVKALKSYLKTKKYLWGSTARALKHVHILPITGKMDEATVKRLQMCMLTLRVLPDPLQVTGNFDFRTQMALQKFLNKNGMKVSEDGKFGYNSKKALQTFLNKNWAMAGWQKSTLWRDGSFGDKTVKAFQTYLNAMSLKC